MISIKNKVALRKMETAGQFLAEICEEIKPSVQVGVSTLFLDDFISKQMAKKGLVSCTKGYMGYKHHSCISLNDEVVHGVPHGSKLLAVGDLVKIDICASWQGYCADMARCFFVEHEESNAKKLVKAAQDSLDAGIVQMRVGGRLTEISAAIQKKWKLKGLGLFVILLAMVLASVCTKSQKF